MMRHTSDLKNNEPVFVSHRYSNKKFRHDAFFKFCYSKTTFFLYVKKTLILATFLIASEDRIQGALWEGYSLAF